MISQPIPSLINYLEGAQVLEHVGVSEGTTGFSVHARLDEEKESVADSAPVKIRLFCSISSHHAYISMQNLWSCRWDDEVYDGDRNWCPKVKPVGKDSLRTCRTTHYATQVNGQVQHLLVCKQSAIAFFQFDWLLRKQDPNIHGHQQNLEVKFLHIHTHTYTHTHTQQTQTHSDIHIHIVHLCAEIFSEFLFFSRCLAEKFRNQTVNTVSYQKQDGEVT